MGAAQPAQCATQHVKDFLTYLAVERNVALATQYQAFNALLFLYRYVLGTFIRELSSIPRSRPARRLPVVLSVEEISAIVRRMNAPYQVMAALMYGNGIRLNECLSLRHKDIDLEHKVLTVRNGKGGKDRYTVISAECLPLLRDQLAQSRELHEQDRRAGRPGVELLHALGNKYPDAGTDLSWFWVFPAPRESVDPRSGIGRCHHIYASSLQKAFKHASRNAGVSSSTREESYSPPAPRSGSDGPRHLWCARGR